MKKALRFYCLKVQQHLVDLSLCLSVAKLQTGYILVLNKRHSYPNNLQNVIN